MTHSYDINSDLTVTVHTDGTVTWSSSSPVNLHEVSSQIVQARDRAAKRIQELDWLLHAMARAPETPSVSGISLVLDTAYPFHPELKFTSVAGLVYVELAHQLPARESAPFIATIASTLESSGYSCTRSRTRVTVRMPGQATTESTPDFVCTRLKKEP